MKAQSRSSSTRTKHSSARPTSAVAAWTRASVLRELRGLADPQVKAKMAYFGVDVPKAHAISAPVLHQFAKRIGRSQELAEELWSSGIHEARILAALIGEPGKITGDQMERWVRHFDSWDVVDAVCCYLYAHARPAWSK